jgi:predicted transposase YbfD/YdcC
MGRFRACFADLADPRAGDAQRHEPREIIMIALLASLCGAESCVGMALFGEAKEPLLRRFLRLPGGIPSHDTFSRLFRLLDPSALEACFRRLAAAFASRIDAVLAVDGKTARRSLDRRTGSGPLHLISARACEQRLVLGQRRVDGRSNEITALPELLEPLGLDGCTVTADAMRCQKATAQAILDRGGDHVLALKADQPELVDDARLLLDDPAAPPDDAAGTVDGDHGRIEVRRAEVIDDVAWLAEARGWPGLAALGKVTAGREIDGQATTSSRYHLPSRPLRAARLAEIARMHRQIENRPHRVLDVVMAEAGSRARKDHGPENLARLRRFALNLPRQRRQRRDPRQDQAGRLGRRLAARHPRQGLMRLPCAILPLTPYPWMRSLPIGTMRAGRRGC